MAERAFYAPLATDDPLKFRLPVENRILVGPPGRQFMMGGVGIAASIDAMERATGRPLICATAQFISYASIGATVDLELTLKAAGKSITQAQVTISEGGREIIAVTGALGGRDGMFESQFAQMPDIPGPEAFEETPGDFPELDDMHREIEKHRIVTSHDEAKGTDRMWFRSSKGLPVTSGLLAVFADFIAGGHSKIAGSSSLDNTIRIHTVKDTKWVLTDTQFSGTAAGAFHAHMRLFADDGTLLATAGQSGALPKRPWK